MKKYILQLSNNYILGVSSIFFCYYLFVQWSFYIPLLAINSATVFMTKIVGENHQQSSNNTSSLRYINRKQGETDFKEVEKKITYIYDGSLNETTTGSMVNCIDPPIFGKIVPSSDDQYPDSQHPDSGTLVASCLKISYRVPLSSFENTGFVIVGILSSGASASGGFQRRKSIRSTWAKDTKGVFFIVAGSWDDIVEEYESFKDLIWINQEEIYDGEISVLTFKTYSFLTIVDHAMKEIGGEYSYCFKVDDDCYVDLQKLRKQLAAISPDYWGYCPEKPNNRYVPLRGRDNKWALSFETYPEPMFPRYCQGAGYALSRKFVECAISRDHVANTRFMPFEDVAVGILAERCNITPFFEEDSIALYRTGTREEVDKVNFDLVQISDDVWLPLANMTNKIIQHRIQDDFDMKEHHRSIFDKMYNKQNMHKQKHDRNWYYYYEKSSKDKENHY